MRQGKRLPAEWSCTQFQELVPEADLLVWSGWRIGVIFRLFLWLVCLEKYSNRICAIYYVYFFSLERIQLVSGLLNQWNFIAKSLRQWIPQKIKQTCCQLGRKWPRNRRTTNLCMFIILPKPIRTNWWWRWQRFWPSDGEVITPGQSTIINLKQLCARRPVGCTCAWALEPGGSTSFARSVLGFWSNLQPAVQILLRG